MGGAAAAWERERQGQFVIDTAPERERERRCGGGLSLSLSLSAHPTTQRLVDQRDSLHKKNSAKGSDKGSSFAKQRPPPPPLDSPHDGGASPTGSITRWNGVVVNTVHAPAEEIHFSLVGYVDERERCDECTEDRHDEHE